MRLHVVSFLKCIWSKDIKLNNCKFFLTIKLINMNPFNYFFASGNLFISRIKSGDILSTGAIIVAAIQLLCYFVLVFCIRFFTGITFMPHIVNPIFWIAISVGWTLLVWLYYKNSHYQLLLLKYQLLSVTKRKTWGWVTLLIVPVLFMVCIGILLVSKQSV